MKKEYKKIVLVTASLHYSGAERVMLALANYLCQKGKEVTMLLIKDDQPKTFSDELNKNIKVEKVSTLSKYDKKKISKIFSIRKKIREINPDVVLSFNCHYNVILLIALAFLNIPLIGSERNDPKIEPKEPYFRLFRKILYKYIDGIVFQTEEIKSFFPEEIQLKSKIIPNPIVAEITQIDTIKDKKKEIVTVARLDQRQKNQLLLINAFNKISAKFNDYKLILYGEGPDRKLFEDEVERLNLNNRVEIPGAIADAPNKIKDASLFVLPSYFEGMPNALIEAMSVGLPCIATDCGGGGAKFLIDNNQNGILVPNNDVDELVNAMEVMLSNEELANKKAKNAKISMNRLDPKIVFEEWNKYIESIFDNKNA